MKKRILSIIVAVTVCLTCGFVVPTTMHQNDCFAKAKTKYVKIKQSTYNNMKKTIKTQKKTIASQKSTITARNKTIAAQKSTIATQSQTLKNNTTTINELNATIKEKKSTISWLWDQLEAFGYKYNYDTHKWETQETDDEEEPPSQQPLDWAELEQTTGIIPIMEEQTGLTIDKVQIVDSWRAWVCYYVEADGDLYTITMQRGVVDVCTILN